MVDAAVEKPTVLVAVTYPNAFKVALNQVADKGGERGYNFVYFDIAQLAHLLVAAKKLSAESKPVAVILSQVMKASDPSVSHLPNRKNIYRAKHNGDEFAEIIGRVVQGKTLCMIFSGQMGGCNGILRDVDHNVVNIDGKMDVGLQVNFVTSGLDLFFFARSFVVFL